MQGIFRQSIHPQSGGAGQGRPPKSNPIKFEGDYDFEQANNKFEELRLELAKLKVAGGSAAGGDEAAATSKATGSSESSAQQQQSTANGEADKKDDSGNETGAGDHEHEDDDGQDGSGGAGGGYDKAKSFFDNISCEAVTDRTKGKHRTDWRHERKINSETFGVSARRGG